MPKFNKGIKSAIEFFGSQKALADTILCNRRSIGYWLRGTRTIPPAYAKKIAEVCKGKVKLEELRPDIWDN